MSKTAMYLQTTEVSALKSMGEVQSVLVQSGASRISQEFDEKQRVVGFAFAIRSNGDELPFRLPVRTNPVFQKLQARRKSWDRSQYEEKDREQAERIAWRQLLYWIKAQLAMVDTGMVQPIEVFLPYLAMRDGATLFERMAETKFKALPAPPERDE